MSPYELLSLSPQYPWYKKLTQFITVIDLPFIQAQQVAFALMKYHAELLDDDQTEFVSSYLDDIKHKARRKKLTATKAYRVLNIGTKINRQLFKANRKSR